MLTTSIYFRQLLFLGSVLHCYVMDCECEMLNENGIFQYSRSFSEKDYIPVNKHITTVQRTLPDFPIGPYRTFIENSNFVFVNDFFSVNNAGELSTLKAVDRDDRDSVCGPLHCCQNVFCEIRFECIFVPMISLEDESAGLSPPWKRANVRILMTLTDLNDNEPFFPLQQYNITVDEADSYSSALELPQAKDLDSKDNGVVKYSLSGQEKYSPNLFSLRYDANLLPKLFIRRSLDYENPRERLFSFHLVAVDGGYPERSGSILINVMVNDVNDETPQCQPSKNEIRVDENRTISQSIYQVNCTDRDSSLNGELHYSFGNFLQPPTAITKFKIHPKTGEVFLISPLDYEKFSEQKFILPIHARDGGASPKSSIFTLTVLVNDINDNYPNLRLKQNKTVKENSPPGVEVLNLYVWDDDMLSKGKIQCVSKPKTNVLPGQLKLQKLSETVLIVYTNTSFDYEFQKTASITIECSDGELSSSHEMIVAIEDVNDNDPYFVNSCPLETKFSEGADILNFALLVEANDQDSEAFGPLTYTLQDSTTTFHEQMFSVDETTGRVSLMRPLDREEKAKHRFSVEVRDGGKRRAACEVQIVVTDANDCAPEYIGEMSFEILEHSSPGSKVAHLQFMDRDEGLNAKYDLKILNIYPYLGNLSMDDLIEIESNGDLVLMGDLDREMSETMFIDVSAIDRGVPPLTTTTTLTIRLLDINDHAPRLVYPPPNSIIGLRSLVYRDSPFGTPVITMKALDADFGSNGTVNFRLLRTNGTEYFYLNETSGTVLTGWIPDNQPEEKVYHIGIELYDLGFPTSKRSQAFFFVLINAPLENLEEAQRQSIARISNIVILALIVILSVALCAALIAGIIWAKSRTSLSSSPRWPASYGNGNGADYGPQVKMLIDTAALPTNGTYSNTQDNSIGLDGTLLSGTCRKYDSSGYPISFPVQSGMAYVTSANQGYRETIQAPQYYSTMQQTLGHSEDESLSTKFSECSPQIPSSTFESVYADSRSSRPSQKMESLYPGGCIPMESGYYPSCSMTLSRSEMTDGPIVMYSTNADNPSFNQLYSFESHGSNSKPTHGFGLSPSCSRELSSSTAVPLATLLHGVHNYKQYYRYPLQQYQQLQQQQLQPQQQQQEHKPNSGSPRGPVDTNSSSRRQSQLSIADSGRGGSEDDFLRQQQQQQQHLLLPASSVGNTIVTGRHATPKTRISVASTSVTHQGSIC